MLPAFTPSFVNSRSYHFERSVSEAGLLATWVQDDIEGAVRATLAGTSGHRSDQTGRRLALALSEL